MALAFKFQGMVDSREVRDYADLARLGYVTRARITQIMNLLNLAPDLQETLLTFSPTSIKRDAITERHLRPIVTEAHWPEQRRIFNKLSAQNLIAKSSGIPMKLEPGPASAPATVDVVR
jgi:hypothetical protein